MSLSENQTPPQIRAMPELKCVFCFDVFPKGYKSVQVCPKNSDAGWGIYYLKISSIYVLVSIENNVFSQKPADVTHVPL